jgi:hypothetical protein
MPALCRLRTSIWRIYALRMECPGLSSWRLDMFDIFFLALGAGFFGLTFILARLMARV